MIIKADNLVKEYELKDGKVACVTITNAITGAVIKVADPDEFVISVAGKKKLFGGRSFKYIKMSDCRLLRAEDGELQYDYSDGGATWKIRLKNIAVDKALAMQLTFKCSDDDVIIDAVEYGNYNVDSSKFSWSRPNLRELIHIPPYWATVGQPVYYDSFFMGVEFPTADNRIYKGKTSLKYYIGRRVGELKDYTPYRAIVGAAIADNMIALKKCFFDYVDTFARPKRFRIQFNSWYDNMLDITHENLEQSFRAINKEFKAHGLRDIDCYVVDDGWVDYRKDEFWAFNDKFKDGFDKESKLTEEFNSTFGVWFGPRGGYTEAASFAHHLEKIGYHFNILSRDICVCDPKYAHDLGDKMAEFMKKYNTTYFKIDGFAARPCPNPNHGHPVGGYKDLYFYTFLWEQWYKAFEKLREINPDVFLNVTSYSNCSPWALKWADSIWMNNAGDMAYEGAGDNLNQCLNYRDGRYHNLSFVRQLQFPNAYIYNHEPCYATRNYNPPLPNKSHKTVVYDSKQFEQYLYMCMMRGTGFIELYYSPTMFDDEKWNINTKVLSWAEKNFDVISQSVIFGGVPKNGQVYGYFAYNDGKAYIAIRNPKAQKQSYSLDVKEYSHRDGEYEYDIFYSNNDKKEIIRQGNKLNFDLEPFEMKILYLEYKE